MKEVNELVQTVFSGLSPLVIEDLVDECERIVVRARTPQDTVVCPVCEASSGRVHGYHWRTVADVPVDGRRVVVNSCSAIQKMPTRSSSGSHGPAQSICHISTPSPGDWSETATL